MPGGPAAAPAALALAALALALSVGSARQRQAAFVRSSQSGTLRVETTGDGATLSMRLKSAQR
jgi:hypothetical protein